MCNCPMRRGRHQSGCPEKRTPRPKLGGPTTHRRVTLAESAMIDEWRKMGLSALWQPISALPQGFGPIVAATAKGDILGIYADAEDLDAQGFDDAAAFCLPLGPVPKVK